MLEDIHFVVDAYAAEEILEAGSYPVLDPSEPTGSRPPTAYERPVVCDTATDGVKEVRVRRAP